MRTWGSAFGPGYLKGVDVGINSRGLVTAFARDIAVLPPSEQLHWAHYSSLPDGEVCDALFQTRMQNDPPHLPGVVDLDTAARAEFAEAYRLRFGVEVYGGYEPSSHDMARMSVGPVRGEMREVIDLAKTLYTWTTESLRVPALRLPLDAKAVKYDPTWKQIMLLGAHPLQ